MTRISIIDSHTGGEPTRVVVGGGPALGGGSVADRLKLFRERHDQFRSAIVNEPRGSDVLVGALLCEPADKSCAAGVIFFNNVGYLGMCGHGTIGLVVTLAHLGRIGPGEHRLETPVGVVTATLNADGSVSVGNVNSYRKAKGVTIELREGDGARGLSRRSDAKAEATRPATVTGDVAWGGNWFFLVNDPDLELELANVEQLTDFTWQIRQAINAQGFPEVDHVELVQEVSSSSGEKLEPPHVGSYQGKVTRNFVLCPGKAYDRSPCGTGTSAKLACLAANGELAEGEEHVVESIIGSRFVGKFKWVDRARGIIAPTITGTAHVNAEATLLLDECDPYCWGIGSGARVSNPPGLRKSIPQSAQASTTTPTTAGKPTAGAQLRDGLPRSRKEHVRQLVAQRQYWHAHQIPATEAKAGFLGWHTRGYLPHFDRKGVYQFVTFRLADALPASKRFEWEPLLSIEDDRQRSTKLEAYLDKGYGACFLRRPEVASLVQGALLKFDGLRYRLFGWCVMPNHVHALLEITDTPLKKIMHTWKAYTALQANRNLGRSGEFWQAEYFDRFMRDEEHFRRTLRYIEANPVKAGLVKVARDWLWSSARFADATKDRATDVQPARRWEDLRRSL